MKKFLIAAIAASLVGTPAMAQPWRGQEISRTKIVQNQRGHVVKRVTLRKATPRARGWAKGQRFDRRDARDYRVISTPRAYRLHNPPRGHQWERSGNDAVLVSIATGLIAAVLGNAIL